MLILEKLNEDGHFNHEHSVARIVKMVRKANSHGLGQEDIDELYELVPACLLPLYYGDKRHELDWHRFDLCIVAANQDMELARRIVKELRAHFTQLRVYVDDEQVIGPQEKLIKRTYYGGSRLCLALISVHLKHDARRKVELNNARLRVKDMLKSRRITSGDSAAYLKPIPLDEQGRLFMEKAKDLAPFVKHFTLIQDQDHLSRVVVKSLLNELIKYRDLLPGDSSDGDRLKRKGDAQNSEVKYEVFISHSRKDEAFARRLYDDLQARGIDCWFAPENMTIGASIRDAIEDALRPHRKLVLILSENAIKSLWVQNEVELAFEKERKSRKKNILFPIKIDNSIDNATAAWARTLWRERHIGDFTGWENTGTYKRALERLVLALQSE